MGYKGGSSGKECQHVLRHIELVEHPREGPRMWFLLAPKEIMLTPKVVQPTKKLACTYLDNIQAYLYHSKCNTCNKPKLINGRIQSYLIPLFYYARKHVQI